MSPLSFRRMRFYWRRLTRLDRVALVAVALYGAAWISGRMGYEPPQAGLLGFLFFLSAAYLVLRGVMQFRGRLLWSLRNRLVVAYIFIAVVPVLLLLVMAALSAYLIYTQLGAYLLYDDLQKRIEKVAATAEALAASFDASAVPPASGQQAVPGPDSQPAVEALVESWREEMPGLLVEIGAGQDILEKHGGPLGRGFAGIVQRGEQVSITAVVSRKRPSDSVRRARSAAVVSVSLPVTPDLLESLEPELGPLQFVITRPATPADSDRPIFTIGERSFLAAGQISTRRRSLGEAASWLDYKIDGFAKFEAVVAGPRGVEQATSPVFISFSTRPSQLNRRLFTSLGELRDLPVLLLFSVGLIFLILEFAALLTGIALTRSITRAVSDLYSATQHVQSGDLTYRVRIQRKDQLGVLGESFNGMTSAVSELIEEQRRRQRLENELEIAREVQAQLFPRELPTLPGIEVAAICRAARVVSGDYYDFIRLGTDKLGIAIADISGKGISAALLMASLQAALRSQVLMDGQAPPAPGAADGQNVAELVRRLNLHLYLNTSEEKYATFFFALYDAATHTLQYTNAGHVAPYYVVGDEVKRLAEGGMVVGLFDECEYEQGSLVVTPGSLLVAYSDGITEPENVYGEEFGSRRLQDAILRYRQAGPARLAESLVLSAEEWAGSPEQADDMTVIVARFT